MLFAVGSQPSERPLGAEGETIAVTSQRSVVITAQRALFLLLLAVAVPFEILKFCAARVDYHGAVRLAVVIVLVEIVAAVLRLESSATFHDGLSRLCMAVVRAVGIAGLLGVFYLAVDAYARRLWPHLLVTWNRLLLGRFGDLDVRFHTLVGVCVGCWWAFVTGAISAFIVISIVFFARGAEFIKKIEPVFSASAGSMHDAATALHDLGSKSFQEAVDADRLEVWLREIGKQHGKLTAVKLDQSNPVARNPSGEAVLNIDGKFVNGPATIRLTFTKENIWTPRIDDIEVSGSSPRASPDKKP